jgi:hypothetical protein
MLISSRIGWDEKEKKRQSRKSGIAGKDRPMLQNKPLAVRKFRTVDEA